MGRAQVMQAEACQIEPDCRMNPVLLKPTSDKGSQVILNGEVYAHFHAILGDKGIHRHILRFKGSYFIAVLL